MRRITGSMVLFWGAASIGHSSMGQPINHPVISEFRFFEHKDVNEEFVELHNPTAKEISLNKWKLAYKKKTGGEWHVKAVFGPGHVIPPHGFFLWGGDKVNVQPDAVESSRYSINLSSTAGHIALRDSSDRVVDLAAWGGGDSPEGISISGPFIEGGSVERKANGSSTTLSMIPPGADASAGNGFDTDDNRSDFVLHNHFIETNPQNVSSPREPEWIEPAGSGTCSVHPGTVFVLDTVSLRFMVRFDNATGFRELFIRIPDGWGWTFRPEEVRLDGGCFRNSEVTVSSDTVRIAGLDLAAQDSGAVVLQSIIAPAESDSSEFPVFLSGSGEGPVSIEGFPVVFIQPKEFPAGLEKGRLQAFPSALELFQNFPNPFNQETIIRYRLPVIGSVRVAVFDLKGREVALLTRQRQAAGDHAVRWDGREDAGMPLPTGVYVVRIRTETEFKTLKCLLLR